MSNPLYLMFSPARLQGIAEQRHGIDRQLSILKRMGANAETLHKLESDAKRQATASTDTFWQCFDRLYSIEYERLATGEHTPSEVEDLTVEEQKP